MKKPWTLLSIPVLMTLRILAVLFARKSGRLPAVSGNNPLPEVESETADPTAGGEDYGRAS
jgi:hypothetical protein